MMAYVTAEDDTAAIELVVFPRSLQQCGAYLTEDSAVPFTGKIDAREDEAPKVAERGAAAHRRVQWRACSSRKRARRSRSTPMRRRQSWRRKSCSLRISSLQSDEWTQIKEVLCTQPGDTPVYLYPMDTKKKTLAARRYWCKPDIAF